MSDEKKTVLSMRHINKTFPGVKALSDAQLTLREGEIHALMGENGAGKSTLIKVLTGVEEFETGEIIMDGKSIIIKDLLCLCIHRLPVDPPHFHWFSSDKDIFCYR